MQNACFIVREPRRRDAGEEIPYVYFAPIPVLVSLLATMSDGRGIETATIGSEGVIGATSSFGGHIDHT
jgi:hypothetical protein